MQVNFIKISIADFYILVYVALVNYQQHHVVLWTTVFQVHCAGE